VIHRKAAGPQLAASLADLVDERNWRIAVAESLTCGRILSTLGAAPNAANWLAGGVVAYRAEIKYRLLGVAPGPVISQTCAEQMASGVARLMRAHVSIAVTGCGGPDPEEGQAPGTVFIAASVRGQTTHENFHFKGTPAAVLESTTNEALKLLGSAIREFQI